MTEFPTKRVPASVGKKLFDFARDEETNFQNAAYDLIEEMHFLDTIADLMNRWLNRDAPLLPDESIFYGLCGFMRTQMFQGCSTYMRGHLSNGMVASRLCVEAALYAEAIAGGYLTEEEYLTNSAKRENLARHLRNYEREGRLPKRISVLLQCVSMLSAHGAHAEVHTWGNRLVGSTNEGWFLSFFQRAPSHDRFTYDFLGLLWFAGLAFVSFLEIARGKFGIECDAFMAPVLEWQDAMEKNKSKFNLQGVA